MKDNVSGFALRSRILFLTRSKSLIEPLCALPNRAVAQRAAGRHGWRFSLNIGGREERYLIFACTVITDVPEAVGP